MLSIPLSSAVDFQGWRAAARSLIQQDIPPENIEWVVSDAHPTLFSSLTTRVPTARLAKTDFRVPRAFVDLAEYAVLHRDPMRFGLLYRLLWRLREQPALLSVSMDADVHALDRMASAVRREIHKMHAFVRFREAPYASPPRSIAWFEPEHHVLEAAAPFFVRRFAALRWSILTPRCSAHWDRAELTFGPGAAKTDAPAHDAAEDLWRNYYASIFNPARLNVRTMRSHMPQRYWRNLPEATLIPTLVADAAARTQDMLNKTPVETRKRRKPLRPERVHPEIIDTDLDALRVAVQKCRDCPLWRNATQAVFGAGLKRAKVMFVGEQPGDQEDLSGEPFVGPAGRMLDRALEEAGVDRKLTYVTNAVKHFKFEPRGKRRIHKKPNEMEIAACNQWLQRELRAVEPDLVVALGATGARAVFGKATAIEKNRGRIIENIEAAGVHATDVLVTVHPSFLLRVPDADRKAAYDKFVADLKLARKYAAKH